MKRKTVNADLCIIGAGSAGLSVAAGAAQLGRKVVLIEKDEMGGDCLNTGCVPSKALIAAAEHAASMRDAHKFGIGDVEPQIDFAAVMEHVAGVIETIAPIDSQERFEGFGVNVIREQAAFSAPREVETDSARIRAKHFVIATGSKPFIPPIEGLSDVPFFTNETIFANRTLPSHLIVIGGGPIGVEMAQAHRRLGAQVTVVEGRSILGKDDPELVAIVRAQLEQDGITLLEGAKVSSVHRSESGVSVNVGGASVDGSHILVAAGRTPTVDGLNLDAAGVAYDARGVKTDSRLRTTNKRIFAIGDVAGGRQFTHVAGYHASVLVKNILFKAPAKNAEHLAPWVTYCDPELAHVGLSEKEAREQFKDIRTATWSLEENDRAQAERDTRGMIKVITAKNGKILGASIVGRNAGDLIGAWSLAITSGLKIRAFTDMIAPYPTRGEISKRVAGAWYTPTLFSAKTKRLVSLLSLFD